MNALHDKILLAEKEINRAVISERAPFHHVTLVYEREHHSAAAVDLVLVVQNLCMMMMTGCYGVANLVYGV